MQGAPPSGNITSPSDLMMAPEGQQQGMNPGGLDALKNGIQMFLKFMSPEQLLETLLKMAELGEMGVSEDKLRAMIQHVMSEEPYQAEGQMPSETEAAMGVGQAKIGSGDVMGKFNEMMQ
jgi:hypothetical protein